MLFNIIKFLSTFAYFYNLYAYDQYLKIKADVIIFVTPCIYIHAQLYMHFNIIKYNDFSIKILSLFLN